MYKEKKIVKEHALKMIDFEKKKIIPLKNVQQESYEKIKTCYICN